MGTDRARLTSVRSPTVRWPVTAGIAVYVAGLAMLGLLSPVTRTLGQVLGLPTGARALLLAGPAGVVGALAWWQLVERRDDRRYRAGLAFGAATAVGSVAVWVTVSALMLGPVVFTAAPVVGLVLVVMLPPALVVGLVLVFVRRRQAGTIA